MDLINKYHLPENYRYMKEKEKSYDSETKYSCDIRIAEIRDENSALEWLVSFQKSSKCIWNVARTHKVSGKHILFRKDFKCELHVNISKKFQSLKDTGCPASLTIKIYRYDGRYKCVLDAPDEFPCLVEINNIHNHSINSTLPLIKEPVKEELRRMFLSGHTPPSADRTLHMQVFSIDDSEESSSLLTLADVKYQLSEFRLLYGFKDRDSVHADLKSFCHNYCKTSGGKADVFKDGNDVAIAVCTPIMQNTARFLLQADEIILVDAPNFRYTQNHRIYFFVVPAIPGGAPIGCVITNSDKPSVFESGVKLFQSCLPAEANFLKNGPKYFITNGNENEKSSLKAVWPNSKFLSSQFHVLKGMWDWLCKDGKSSMLMPRRHEVFFAFKAVMYSDTEEEFDEKSEWLLNNDVTLKNMKFQKYLLRLLSNKLSWASFARKDVSLKGSTTNIGSEIAFRIIRDSMLERMKSHTLIQVMDCITVIFERYLYNRYLDYDSGKYIRSLINKFLVARPGRKKYEATVEYEDETECFKIEAYQLYFVDAISSLCTCKNSILNYLCVHIMQVFKNFDLDLAFTQNKELICKLVELPIIDSTNSIAFQDRENSVAKDSFDDSNANRTNFTHNNNLKELDEIFNSVAKDSFDDSNANRTNFTHNNNLKELDEIFNRIKTGLKEKPEIFENAVSQMIMNAKSFASTENGLISAMNNFGKWSLSNSPVIQSQTTTPDKKACSNLKRKALVNKYESLKKFRKAYNLSCQ